MSKLHRELHIPRYQYCVPGTKLHKRLSRNDPRINILDRACKGYDIAYASTGSIERNKADKILEAASERIKASVASTVENMAAEGLKVQLK